MPSRRHVFHDPSGNRQRWIQRLAVLLGAVFFALAAVFALSLVIVPALPPAAGLGAPLRHAIVTDLAHGAKREARIDRFLLARERRRLLGEIARDTHVRQRRAAQRPTPSDYVVGAFYVTWQETGLHSLRANAAHLTHLFPVWLQLGPDGAHLSTSEWDPRYTPHNLDVLRIAREHHLLVMPVLTNAREAVFDRASVHRLLESSARQDTLIAELAQWLESHHFAGVNLDFENLPAADDARLPAFVTRVHTALAPRGLVVSVDAESEADENQLARFGRAADFVILMAYDEHYAGGDAGALCGIEWFRGVLQRARARIPADKLVVGVGNYAYDWTGGRAPANTLTYQEALLTASENHPDEPPDSIVDFDPVELNATYHYEDEAGRDHEVWMLDAISAANQWTLSRSAGARGTAVWVLGTEDPSIWTMFDRTHPLAPASVPALESTSFPYDIEFDGDGEILSVATRPQKGARELDRDSTSALFTDERYSRFPTSYVIRRQGFQDKTIAVTFDDGPSSPWTGRVLDVLRDAHVPGTFFVIGENAERHPDLVARLWREGHEIGNHTYTHPNMAAITPAQVTLELNATQRVLQADLGRSTLLFRPPYNADAEPTSAEEVQPMLAAAKLGYLTIGEYLDPQDWNLRQVDSTGATRSRTATDIAQTILDEVHAGHGNALLLHDGGGNRAATVEALRRVLPVLKAEGYRFVTISQLAGVPRDKVMPLVDSRDRALLGGDRITFEALWLTEGFLHWAFLSGIALGALRVLWVTVLALLGRGREKRRPFAGTPPPPVSVLIAAFNERPVIRRTIEAVLVGDLQPIEVVVVDDGSTDGTFEEVERAFGAEPRVRLIRQTNAGKAQALNRAIEASRGEILVCLDADTVFTRETLSRLARHFDRPEIGAVAGNVKVGNRVNVWTKWQALEYITSQNLDRRAYALLNAITVVPGAVGAWRREAVRDAGGYRSDTLAEDMDLTWRLRRAGWRIENDSTALGWTEAPDSLGTLYRQRFRWAFGTLQCLWKHRDAMGRNGWFGCVALPSLWLFQIVFQALSPLVDLQVAWTLVRAGEVTLTRGLLTRDWQPLPQAVAALSSVLFLYLFFFVLELIGAVVAIALDRERWRLLGWLFWQRFVYRQVMYAVVLRSLRMALVGRAAGWGKLERKGTVATAT
ncbi:MAG TPA: glycosyltransferase [Candidatus Saccharimonadaceae bacterium]|nr:glycosyltransferase [Candidatus Saccharimonadaceae bacterium]